MHRASHNRSATQGFKHHQFFLEHFPAIPCKAFHKAGKALLPDSAHVFKPFDRIIPGKQLSGFGLYGVRELPGY